MPAISIRPATGRDLPRLTEIYNYYVINTPVAFDIEPYTVERRAAWFNQFSSSGRYRLFVAEETGVVLGYAGTSCFRPKAAYETTVGTSVYCAPDAVPNPASATLHERFGFKRVGVFTENGRKFGCYWDVAWNERPADGK